MPDEFISQLVEENRKHRQAIEQLRTDLQQTIFILNQLVSLPVRGGSGERSSILSNDAQAIWEELKGRCHVA